MKKSVFLILVMSLLLFGAQSVDAEIKYDLNDLDGNSNYIVTKNVKNGETIVSTLTVKKRMYVDWNVSFIENKAYYPGIEGDFFSVTVQKKEKGKWITISTEQGTRTVDGSQDWYGVRVERCFSKGKYRFVTTPNFPEIMLNYYAEEYGKIKNTSIKKAKKIKIKNNKNFIILPDDNGSQFLKVKIKKNGKYNVNVFGKIFSGRTKITLYNTKKKKVYEKVIKRKKSEDLLRKKIKLTKGTYYIKISKYKKTNAKVSLMLE